MAAPVGGGGSRPPTPPLPPPADPVADAAVEAEREREDAGREIPPANIEILMAMAGARAARLHANFLRAVAARDPNVGWIHDELYEAQRAHVEDLFFGPPDDARVEPIGDEPPAMNEQKEMAPALAAAAAPPPQRDQKDPEEPERAAAAAPPAAPVPLRVVEGVPSPRMLALRQALARLRGDGVADVDDDAPLDENVEGELVDSPASSPEPDSPLPAGGGGSHLAN